MISSFLSAKLFVKELFFDNLNDGFLWMTVISPDALFEGTADGATRATSNYEDWSVGICFSSEDAGRSYILTMFVD